MVQGDPAYWMDDSHTRDERRQRSCERKKWYRTREQAESAIVNMNSKVYECEFCCGFHIATKR